MTKLVKRLTLISTLFFFVGCGTFQTQLTDAELQGAYTFELISAPNTHGAIVFYDEGTDAHARGKLVTPMGNECEFSKLLKDDAHWNAACEYGRLKFKVIDDQLFGVYALPVDEVPPSALAPLASRTLVTPDRYIEPIFATLLHYEVRGEQYIEQVEEEDVDQ